MTVARRRLKVGVLGQSQGREHVGRAYAVCPTSIEGSLFSIWNIKSQSVYLVAGHVWSYGRDCTPRAVRLH